MTRSCDVLGFLDLSQRVRGSREDLDAAYARVMTSGQFILGEEMLLPLTEVMARSVLSLPLQPYLQPAGIDRDCDKVAEWGL